MGGIVSSFFGASPPSAPNLTTYQPQYTSQSDTSAFAGINQIQANNPYSQNQPAYLAAEQAGANSPYAAGVQSSANTAGGQLTALGQTGIADSNALNAGAMSLLPYVSQVENLSMDPQQGLYNQQSQQASDQANANNAAYGVTGPYAASTANQANQNFNLGWQNNLLSRATTGLGAAGSAVGSAANGLNAAQTIGSNAAANTILGGTTPNTAYYANLANVLGALNSYGTSQTAANTNTQQATSDYLQYLQGGEQQANQQAELTQQQYEDEMQSVQAQNAQLGQQVAAITGLAQPSAIGGAIGTAGSPATVNPITGVSTPGTSNSSILGALSSLFSGAFS